MVVFFLLCGTFSNACRFTLHDISTCVLNNHKIACFYRKMNEVIYQKCQTVLTAGIEFVKIWHGDLVAWIKLWDAALARLWKGRVLEMPGIE